MLDLSLPIASGFVVLRWLNEQPVLRRLPVVVFSSSDRDEDVNLAYDLGANAYIVKPNGLKLLGEVADQIARFWLALNRRPNDQPTRSVGRLMAADTHVAGSRAAWYIRQVLLGLGHPI